MQTINVVPMTGGDLETDVKVTDIYCSLEVSNMNLEPKFAANCAGILDGKSHTTWRMKKRQM